MKQSSTWALFFSVSLLWSPLSILATQPQDQILAEMRQQLRDRDMLLVGEALQGIEKQLQQSCAPSISPAAKEVLVQRLERFFSSFANEEPLTCKDKATGITYCMHCKYKDRQQKKKFKLRDQYTDYTRALMTIYERFVAIALSSETKSLLEKTKPLFDEQYLRSADVFTLRTIGEIIRYAFVVEYLVHGPMTVGTIPEIELDVYHPFREISSLEEEPPLTDKEYIIKIYATRLGSFDLILGLLEWLENFEVVQRPLLTSTESIITLHHRTLLATLLNTIWQLMGSYAESSVMEYYRRRGVFFDVTPANFHQILMCLAVVEQFDFEGLFFRELYSNVDTEKQRQAYAQFLATNKAKLRERGMSDEVDINCTSCSIELLYLAAAKVDALVKALESDVLSTDFFDRVSYASATPMDNGL